jgi:hypothetical protein
MQRADRLNGILRSKVARQGQNVREPEFECVFSVSRRPCGAHLEMARFDTGIPDPGGKSRHHYGGSPVDGLRARIERAGTATRPCKDPALAREFGAARWHRAAAGPNRTTSPRAIRNLDRGDTAAMPGVPPGSLPRWARCGGGERVFRSGPCGIALNPRRAQWRRADVGRAYLAPPTTPDKARHVVGRRRGAGANARGSARGGEGGQGRLRSAARGVPQRGGTDPGA